MQEKGANVPERGVRMQISKIKVDVVMARKGLNQIQLANDIGINRTRLSSIINGKSCRPSTITRIAKALGVDVTEIIEM